MEIETLSRFEEARGRILYGEEIQIDEVISLCLPRQPTTRGSQEKIEENLPVAVVGENFDCEMIALLLRLTVV